MKYSEQFVSEVAKSEFVKKLKDGIILMDNSEATQWFSCFASGIYSGALRRMSARSRTPLAFGGAIHEGLEAYFKGNPQWREKALAAANEENLDSYGDPKRNTQKLMDILEAYIMEYERVASMRFDILTIDGKPAVEQSFVVPLGTIELKPGRELFGKSGFEIQWAGKIDLLTNYEDGIAPIDHKSTSVMGEKFVDDKARSTQMLGYTYAARYLSHTLFGGKPVFGCRINALAMRSSGYEFRLFDLPFPDWKVAEWQRETIIAMTELVAKMWEFLATGELAPTREHCVTKYGKCPYFDVCDSPVSMRDRMIFDENYYYISEWSPLNE